MSLSLYLCLHLLLSPVVVLFVLVGSQNLLFDAQQNCLTAVTPAMETPALSSSEAQHLRGLPSTTLLLDGRTSPSPSRQVHRYSGLGEFPGIQL